jgi:hypothetical protein
MIHDRFGGSGRSGKLCEAPSTTGRALIHVLRYEPLGLADHQQHLFLLRHKLCQEIALQAY